MAKWQCLVWNRLFLSSPWLSHTRKAEGSSLEPILFCFGSVFMLKGEWEQELCPEHARAEGAVTWVLVAIWQEQAHLGHLGTCVSLAGSPGRSCGSCQKPGW